MASDEALMLDFQRGSREAFEELFSRYREPLYGFFRRRLAPTSRAEDLTHETFLAVIQATSRYEPRATVRSYLYGIAFHLVLAERRKVSQGVESAISGEPASREVPPDISLWVQQALGKLEDTEREILMLREYEQLSYDEIARLLRVPVNTVRSRLYRSRMAMKNLLQPSEA